MPTPDYTNPEFWKELRKRTRVDGRIGVEECSCWCEDVLWSLPDNRHGFYRIVGRISEESARNNGLYIMAHCVLAREMPSGIFIADGTAGQVDERFPEGYYDYYVNAPQRLKLFYTDAIRKFKGEVPYSVIEYLYDMHSLQ